MISLGDKAECSGWRQNLAGVLGRCGGARTPSDRDTASTKQKMKRKKDNIMDKYRYKYKLELTAKVMEFLFLQIEQ